LGKYHCTLVLLLHSSPASTAGNRPTDWCCDSAPLFAAHRHLTDTLTREGQSAVLHCGVTLLYIIVLNHTETCFQTWKKNSC